MTSTPPHGGDRMYAPFHSRVTLERRNRLGLDGPPSNALVPATQQPDDGTWRTGLSIDRSGQVSLFGRSVSAAPKTAMWRVVTPVEYTDPHDQKTWQLRTIMFDWSASGLGAKPGSELMAQQQSNGALTSVMRAPTCTLFYDRDPLQDGHIGSHVAQSGQTGVTSSPPVLLKQQTLTLTEPPCAISRGEPILGDVMHGVFGVVLNEHLDASEYPNLPSAIADHLHTPPGVHCVYAGKACVSEPGRGSHLVGCSVLSRPQEAFADNAPPTVIQEYNGWVHRVHGQRRF